MATIAGAQGLSTNSQVDQLIAQYRAQKEAPIKALKNKVTNLNKKVTAYGDIETKLKSLVTSLTSNLVTTNTIQNSDGTFQQTKNTSEKFDAKTVTSSDDTIVSVSVTDEAISGTFDILVNRLAKSDSIFSSQVITNDTDLASAGNDVGTLIINGVETEISVDLTGDETNKQVLQKIATAINSSGASAKATVVNDSSTTSRLLITASSSGTENAISFTAGSLFNSIGLNDDVNTARTAYTSANAGFQLTDSTQLDSSFKFNGVEMTKSSNTITDLLDGVTLNLKQIQQSTDTPVIIATSLDKDSVKKRVEQFFSDYNEVIKIINTKTNRKTGDLANDSIFSGIKRTLASIMRTAVGSITIEGAPSSLYLIGIEADDDGTLSIKDTTKFNSYLDENVTKVADIFVSKNDDDEVAQGIVHQLETYIKTITDPNTQLDDSVELTKQHIKRVNAQIARYQVKVDNEVLKFQDEFSEMQTIVQALSRQYASIQQFTSGLLGSGNT